MNAALLLSFFNVRPKVLQTPPAFTSSQSWTAPSTTTSLATLVGKGSNGTPLVPGEDGYVIRKEYEKRVNGVLTESSTNYEFKYGTPVPADYCQNVDRSGGIQEKTCYYHTFYEGDTAATNGTSASGFGKTFAGGTAGPANAVTYTNVAVTPLASYNLVIPAGGSITITYYK